MVKRETRHTRVFIESLEKIAKLKKDSGLTGAEIIEDALKAYSKENITPNEESNKFQKSVKTVFDKLRTTQGKLDKDDPAIRNAIKAGDELGIDWSIIPTVEPSITFDDMDDFHNFFNKLRKEHRAEFIKSINDNPSHLKLDNTKPPTGYLDACILSLWGNATIESLNAIMNPDYEDFARPRHDIIQTVKYHVEKPVDGTSWAELHKSWYNTHTKYKGRFETGIDNRIKSLIRANILKPFKGEEFSDKEIDRLERKFINKITSAPDLNLSSNSGEEIMAQLKVKNKNRGRYILYRDLTDDENIIIEGILRLQPQKGIVIPKII